MDNGKWEVLKRCARMEAMEKTPVALIVDSPWIPGYAGVSTIDYLTVPDKWYDAQLKIKEDFPEVIFIPDLWVEFGMTAEPSGFGCKTMFFENNTPAISHLADTPEDIMDLCGMKLPNPKTDGVMPLVLNLYKNAYQRIKGTGESIKIVAARGPLTIASHIMGVTNFLIALKIYPDETHKMLRLTSQMARVWLKAQLGVLPDAEGVIMLDDICGFLSKDDYLEFAHGYFKSVYDAFPGSLKIFHDDTDNNVPYEFISDLGVNIFNFTHMQDIAEVKKLCGDGVCLMGNIPPLDVLGMSAPEMHEVFKKWNETELDSYLIKITGDILAYSDGDGAPLVDKILDTAGQKGTGKWTGIAALDEGVPLTLIGEAVFARCLSAMKDERVTAAKAFSREKARLSGGREE